MEVSEGDLERFFSTVLPLLDERQRRLVAAAMVGVLGRGGPVESRGVFGIYAFWRLPNYWLRAA